MLKQSVAAIALLAFASPAFAQPIEIVTDAEVTVHDEAHAEIGTVLASDLIGKELNVRTADGLTDVGDINDVVLLADGTIGHVVVGVGGFLGVGEKNVAIPYGTITRELAADDHPLVADVPMALIENDPGFDKSALAYIGGPAVSTMDHSETAMAVAAPGHMRSSDLMGTEVLDRAGDSVGNVGDVILTADGNVDAIVVDVGGFLGVGSKPVAISLGSLTLVVEEDGDKIARSEFAKEEFEAMAAYERIDTQ